MKNLLFLFYISHLTSCQTILKTIYGIKDPEIENQKSIVKKAIQFNFDTTNILTVNGSDFLEVFKGKSIPDGAVYDRNGKYIEYKSTDSSCNAGLFQFIPSLNPSKKYNQPDSSNLESLFLKLRDLYGNQVKAPDSADYYLIIYWTVWTGKLNKDHVKIWEDLAIKNSNSKIRVYKVNLDLQEYWSLDERNKVVKAMSKKSVSRIL